jgi:putative transposase
MKAADCQNILHLYQQIVTAGLLQYLQKQSAVKARRGVFCARVVIWLMMLQRLQRGATLATAVQLLIDGAADPLLQDCHRVRQRSISARTGAYCQARQKLPNLLCVQVSDEIVEQLRQVLAKSEPDKGNVFVLDGSSLELEHCPELLRCYPSAPNQHGKSHWPVVKIVVAHDVDAGMAQSPCWGPMYGGEAVSEQQLAEKLMSRLPTDATLVGDRNFGVFRVAWAAQQRNLNVVLRLTDVRAKKLAGTISQPGEYPVVWRASRWDGGKNHRFADDAAITGRLIAARIGRGRNQQWLYLFTTAALSASEVIALYGRRWNVETDLRSLKRTVRLHHIHARTNDMFEKELLLAVSAYNFVRAVMCMAARRSGTDPRQLSFTGVLNVVNTAWHRLVDAPAGAAHQKEFLRMLDIAAQCTLPKRPKRRSFPRAAWPHNNPFPHRHPPGEN